jgi:LAS superfamily LD-carboxypeptidase LdcB
MCSGMSARRCLVSWSNGLRRELRPHFEALVQAIQRLDPRARVTSAKRSSSEQARLYRRFLAGQSRYPVAPPGRSKHEQGRAIDIIADKRVLEAAGLAWERAGGRWGGRFNDDIHFEA